MKSIARLLALTAGLQIVGTAAGTLAQQSVPESPGSPWDFLVTDIQIPMRDGVSLSGRLYRPLGVDPVPALVTLTPYTSDDAHTRATFFAKHGYLYLNVDTRGRGGSEGESWPLQQDGADGHDVVEWIARQPFCDGRVGMRGGSYRGMAQWQTLKELPSALRTIVPTASVYPGWDYPNPSGIFLSYAARWLAYVSGNASQGALFGDDAYWQGKYREMHSQHRAFADLDDLTGIDPRVFERWIEHPYFDEFWQALSPGRDDYPHFDLPILTITGYFDGDQPGAMKYYQDHMAYGSGQATEKHYLVIGPWNHGGTRNPVRKLGGLSFGESSVIDMEQLHLDWFNWVFFDTGRPDVLRDRVVYYMMGADEWRQAPTLAAVSLDTAKWYLSSSGSASDVFHSGLLTESVPVGGGVDTYVYDPIALVGDGYELATFRDEYVGGGAAFAAGPKLIYHTAALEADVELAGYPKLDVYLELDVPDTDVIAYLYEVRADGQTILLGASELRARHRLGVDRIDLAEPGRVESYRFDRFYWFARRLQQGSRIRLVLMPLDSPERDKNYNSGGNTILETGDDARTAVVKLHHGPEYPSKLSLPLVTWRAPQ